MKFLLNNINDMVMERIKDNGEYFDPWELGERMDIDLEPVTQEELGSDASYHKLLKNERDVERFNFQSDYWGDADSYQNNALEVMYEIEPYIGNVVSIPFENENGELIPEDYILKGLLIDRQYNSHLKLLVEKVLDSQRVNDFYHTDGSTEIKNYSDLSYQDKIYELIATYEYSMSYMLSHISDYVDPNNDQAVRDYITEQVYIFKENDPMFSEENVKSYGVRYDDQFTEDFIEYLYQKFCDEYK